tara:strand:- start:3865 stop:4296 length:432 start_codon:yes stop_codon:yes gene_type:complete
MKILILQGPNLNLLGVKSKQSSENLTLDKLNKHIRKLCSQVNIETKILQTHKQFQAINFLQRNRIKYDSLLIIPTSWARSNWTIVETITLINLPTAVIYFEDPYSFGTTKKESILSGENMKSFSGQPIDACSEGLNYLINQVK